MATLDGRLLRVLRQANPDALLASELAQMLGIPSEEVVERIKKLQLIGYDIEAHPFYGYRFLKSPSHLVAEDIVARLEPQAIGHSIAVLRETRSTNELAIKAGQQGGAHGLVFFAESQTAGRGRHGRKWVSGSIGENLAMSVLLRPDFDVSRWSLLTLAGAYAVALTVESFCSVSVGIKWPNDIQINEKKICGILLESRIASGNSGYVVIGIGLNINQTQFPSDIAQTATSMALVRNGRFDRHDVAEALLRNLQMAYDRIDSSVLLREIALRSTLPGKEIILDTGTELLSGRVNGFDDQGHLLLTKNTGAEMKVSAGEVVRVFT